MPMQVEQQEAGAGSEACVEGEDEEAEDEELPEEEGPSDGHKVLPVLFTAQC